MNQNPINGDPNSGIRYLGWTRSGIAPISGAFLGHPKGDVMKISTFGVAASNADQITFTLCPYPLRQSISPVNTHWTTNINDGALEGGSSGGPFFDQNNRVVGQLHGGFIGCAPKTAHAGRFDVSWTGGGNDNNRLSTWLTNDPNVIQTNTISIPSLSGPSLVCYSGADFFIDNPQGATITWTPSGNLVRVSDQGSNPCTFRAQYESGTGTVQATINNGCGDVPLPGRGVWAGIPPLTYGYEYTYNIFDMEVDDNLLDASEGNSLLA